MGRVETDGYKGWWPVKFYEGKNPDGSVKTSEGFKNVLNNQEVTPREGWNGAPPYPTGDLSNCRHVSEAYRRNYESINWERS
jgi:hypothetical protein